MFLTDGKFNIALVLLGIILAFYLWYTFAIVYHLIRFGVGIKPKTIALIFFVGSIFLFSLAIIIYTQINWATILQ